MLWNPDSDLLLRSLLPADASVVHSLIQQNRTHLDQWLRWSSGIQTLSDTAAFLDTFAAKEAAADGFHLGLWWKDRLVGGLVCWYINRHNRTAELGYWLGADATGRGLATRSAALGVRHLFEAEQLNRVEMQCGVENLASRRVAERLGFTLEGIRRESHWITHRFVDHAVYGLLRREWQS